MQDGGAQSNATTLSAAGRDCRTRLGERASTGSRVPGPSAEERTVQPLTTGQCENLRQALDALAEELRTQIERGAEGARPVALDEPIGRLSRMEAMAQQKMIEATRRAAAQRLERVEAARQRLRANLYGRCASCEEPIGWARLEARPEAALCLACQQEREGRLR